MSRGVRYVFPPEGPEPNLPANWENAPLPETYETAKAALAKCLRIDECRDWANKAEALASYARQSKNDGLHRLAYKIQARATWRMGELLEEFDARGKKDGTVLSRTEAASDAGLSERQRKTAIRIARIPEQDLEEAIEGEDPPTMTMLGKLGTETRSPAQEVRINDIDISPIYWDDIMESVKSIIQDTRYTLEDLVENVLPQKLASDHQDIRQARDLLDQFDTLLAQKRRLTLVDKD